MQKDFCNVQCGSILKSATITNNQNKSIDHDFARGQIFHPCVNEVSRDIPMFPDEIVNIFKILIFFVFVWNQVVTRFLTIFHQSLLKNSVYL